MARALGNVGVDARWYWTFASKADDALNVTSPDCMVINGTIWWLRFDFNGDHEPDNSYEGSVMVPSADRYYAVWPKLTAGSECMLLRQIGPDGINAKQVWLRTSHGNFFDQAIDVLPGFESYPVCP